MIYAVLSRPFNKIRGFYHDENTAQEHVDYINQNAGLTHSGRPITAEVLRVLQPGEEVKKKDDVVTFGGFVKIGDVKPNPERCSCYECRHEDDCEMCDSLREDAKSLYKPCIWFGRDDWEAKEKAGQ